MLGAGQVSAGRKWWYTPAQGSRHTHIPKNRTKKKYEVITSVSMVLWILKSTVLESLVKPWSLFRESMAAFLSQVSTCSQSTATVLDPVLLWFARHPGKSHETALVVPRRLCSLILPKHRLLPFLLVLVLLNKHTHTHAHTKEEEGGRERRERGETERDTDRPTDTNTETHSFWLPGQSQCCLSISHTWSSSGKYGRRWD